MCKMLPLGEPEQLVHGISLYYFYNCTWIHSHLDISSIFKNFIRLIFHLIAGNSFASCLLSHNIGHYFSRLQYNFLIDLVSQIPHTATRLRYQSRPFFLQWKGNVIIPDMWRKTSYLPENENKRKQRESNPSFSPWGPGLPLFLGVTSLALFFFFF